MSEDTPTADLTDSEILQKLAADIRTLVTDMSEVKDRLSKLESTAEDRTRETRPKLDLIIKEVSDSREDVREVRKDLRSLHRKLDIFNNEMLAMKTDIKDFDERLTELERRPN